MRTVQAVEMSCGDCENVALYWTLHDAEKAGWLRYTDTRQDLCPNCATKEKPVTVPEVAELKAQVKELQIALERVRLIRIETQDKLNDIVSDVRQH